MNNSPIITFTPSAGKHIKNLIGIQKGFRLSVSKTGCTGFMYAPSIVEIINPDDLTWETEFGFPQWYADFAPDFMHIEKNELGFTEKGWIDFGWRW